MGDFHLRDGVFIIHDLASSPFLLSCAIFQHCRHHCYHHHHFHHGKGVIWAQVEKRGKTKNSSASWEMISHVFLLLLLLLLLLPSGSNGPWGNKQLCIRWAFFLIIFFITFFSTSCVLPLFFPVENIGRNVAIFPSPFFSVFHCVNWTG